MWTADIFFPSALPKWQSVVHWRWYWAELTTAGRGRHCSPLCAVSPLSLSLVCSHRQTTSHRRRSLAVDYRDVPGNGILLAHGIPMGMGTQVCQNGNKNGYFFKCAKITLGRIDVNFRFMLKTWQNFWLKISDVWRNVKHLIFGVLSWDIFSDGWLITFWTFVNIWLFNDKCHSLVRRKWKRCKPFHILSTSGLTYLRRTSAGS